MWVSGRGWTPERGIHAGFPCDGCGAVPRVIYKGRDLILCEDCRRRKESDA